MDKLKALLDRNLTAMRAAEPYFAPTFAAAAVCGAHGCSCGDTACLHRVCWRMYRYVAGA